MSVLFDDDGLMTPVAVVVLLVVGLALPVGGVLYFSIHEGLQEGQCARKCEPQDSKLTSYWDGWHCVCVDKGVQLDRRDQ